MNDFSYSSSIFLSELMRISKDIVWKNQSEAYANEDPQYAIAVEQFMSAKRGILNFDLIYKFDYDVLRAAGLSQEQADLGVRNKQSIPESFRSTCTSLQIAAIINNYEEHNNYYRMLNGLPDKDDTEFLYNTKYPDISDSITPIHLLPSTAKFALEENGYIDELLKEYPKKKYLKYISKKNIDVYTARNASRFSILWMNSSEYANLETDFVDVYDSCRYSVNRIYYSDAFKKNNPYYDNFLAMCILFMTIQMMHYKFLDADITRDFYDLESIRYIYDSYGVPFYSSIPLEYHKKIVKNINILLSYKGSTRVFFELFDVFNYGLMDVYEYYLLKTHRFENGKPIFVKNSNGEYDLRAMYDIKFGKVRLYDNPPLELSDPSNHIEYTVMTSPDIYWVSDDDLLDKLYSEEYNYMETKYVGVQTLFNMMKIMYESTYYFKILFDNRYALEKSSVYFNAISANVNIFTLAVYVSALICKKYGYMGNIATQLSEISKIMGFNFKANLAVLKEDARKNKYLKDDSILLKLLSTMNINSLASINNAFSNITSLREHLISKMADSHNKDEYFAYYELYNTLMYSELIHDVYKKSNGEIAESFSDLLSDIEPNLYIRMNQDGFDVSSEITAVLSIMKKSCESLQYLEMTDSFNIGVVVEYLFKILDFFKSSKSDLTGYNIVYTMSSRSENIMKLLDYINMSEEEFDDSDAIRRLDDLIKICRDFYSAKEKLLQLKDKFTEKEIIVYIDSKIHQLVDDIKVATDLLIKLSTKLSMNDYIDRIVDISFFKCVNQFSDKLTLLYTHQID